MEAILLSLQHIFLILGCLFLGWLYLGLRDREIDDPPDLPFVSVLVAARNEEEALPGLLASLKAQDYAADQIEFILVDDGSTDQTASLVDQVAGHDPRFKLVRLEETTNRAMGPKKRALSEGLKVAKGSILLFTDADCLVQPTWVSGMVRAFGENVSAVCGMIHLSHISGFWAGLTAFETRINAVMNAAVIGMGQALSCFGANFAYRRSAFDEVGGFDTGARSMSGDDDLLLQKFQRAGKTIRFISRAETYVTTKAPISRDAYWSRKRRHLSAGKRYAGHWIVTAAVVYIGAFLTTLLGILRVLGIMESSLFLAGWLLFSICLYIVYTRGSSFLGLRGGVIPGVIAALLFPIIFTLIQPMTLLPSPSWKGRS